MNSVNDAVAQLYDAVRQAQLMGSINLEWLSQQLQELQRLINNPWTPVSNGLPDPDEEVLVSCVYKGRYFTDQSRWSGVINNGKPQFWDIGEAVTVLAWMRKPAPYTGKGGVM